MLSIGTSTNEPISGFMHYDSHTLFAGISSEVENEGGLYFTQYSYSIENDTPEFTAESAMSIYENNADAMHNEMISVVQKHIDDMHQADSPLNMLNNYMPVDFPLDETNFMSKSGSHNNTPSHI